MGFLKRVVTSFVGNIAEGKYIFSTVRIVWLSENKLAVGHLFDNFKKIGSYVY